GRAADLRVGDEQLGVEARARRTQVLRAEPVGFELRRRRAAPALGNGVVGADGTTQREDFPVVVERGEFFGLLPQRAVALLLRLRVALGQQFTLRGIG